MHNSSNNRYHSITSIIRLFTSNDLAILSSQVYTNARDLARFGLLYEQNGLWNGERVLSEKWIDFVRTPAPAAADFVVPSYDLVIVRKGLDYGKQGFNRWDLTREVLKAFPEDYETTDK